MILLGFLPQNLVFFARQYGLRTRLDDVLGEIAAWRDFLMRDRVLFAEQKSQIDQWLAGAERMVWLAIWDCNRERVGLWELRWIHVPTDPSEPDCINGLWVKARHSQTGEIRETTLSKQEVQPSVFARSLREAYEKLGIANHLWLGRVNRGIMSNRPERAWPIFTQHVIPQLYEYLLPFYAKPPHHSERLDRAIPSRKALYPKELLEDMLALLRMDYAAVFTTATTAQLKAHIQRHLSARSIKP